MWEYNYSNELYHYGVLGMKWGVRRARRKTDKLTKKRAAASSKAENLKRKQDKLENQFEKARAKARKGYYVTDIGKSLTYLRMKKARRTDKKLQRNIKMQEVLEKRISQLDEKIINAGKNYVGD